VALAGVHGYRRRLCSPAAMIAPTTVSPARLNEKDAMVKHAGASDA
jgi:hypothetical protein